MGPVKSGEVRRGVRFCMVGLVQWVWFDMVGPSRTGSISALGVVPARTTSSGRDPKGESPGGNFRLQEVSGEPGWLFTDPFQNIFLFFLTFVPISSFPK